jgi:phosphoglycerate dehydrogenase-like enzyme
MKYQIIRLSSSSYHEKNFLENEKDLIESFNGLEYQFQPKNFSDLPAILISNSSTNYAEIDPELLKITKMIIHPNSGHDNVDLSFSKKGIILVGGNTIRCLPVSEWILGSLFAHYAAIPFRDDWDTSRQWNRSLVSEQNILILGLGHIGKTVFNNLKTINSHISVYDPNVECENSIDSLEEIQDQSIDTIIFCCSLSESSKNILDNKLLSKLRDDGTIINPARGKTIVQKDFENFLETHPKATAYLDVFPNEPFLEEDFNQENVLKSSHIAGCHKNLDKEVSKYCLQVISDFIESENTFATKYKQVILNG